MRAIPCSAAEALLAQADWNEGYPWDRFLSCKNWNISTIYHLNVFQYQDTQKFLIFHTCQREKILLLFKGKRLWHTWSLSANAFFFFFNKIAAVISACLKRSSELPAHEMSLAAKKKFCKLKNILMTLMGVFHSWKLFSQLGKMCQNPSGWFLMYDWWS